MKRCGRSNWMALLLQGIMPGADGSLWGAWSCLVLVPCDRESCPLTFAVGAHSELLHLQFRNGAWTSWPIVGTVGGAVTMASRVVPPTLHRNWESLGGILISPPHAVMFGELNDTISGFALGTDHALWTKASVN